MNRCKPMRHLTPEQLVDVVEGTLPQSAAPHLADCDVCRRSLADLRATMNDAADAGMPEPSPLFWDHLSARVRDEVARQPVPSGAGWMGSWLRPRVVLPVLTAVAAIALAVVVSRRASPPAPIPSTPLPIAESGQLASLPPLEPLGAADDPSLGLMADYGTALGWEDLSEEMPLDTHGGGTDEVVTALSAGERQELQRLLEEEMAQPSELGAS
jgi:hypothetical protein